MSFIIANIFSAIGTFFLAYSTFLKTKNNMLKYQIFDSMFNALGNVFIGSFTGALSNVITIIRNLLNTKGKMTKSLNLFICILVVIIGLLINTNGIIGLLPIIASVQYTISTYTTKTAQGLRYALILNLCFWFIHDLSLGLIPAMIIDIVVIITTFISIIKEIIESKPRNIIKIPV